MTTKRDLGLDAARGVALLSMFVAHFAPSDGPANVLGLSEHLTAFLFVLLIGCGAELGRSSVSRWRASQVRAAALVVLGLALMQLPSAIVVVLVWLGVMTLVAVWVRELPSWGIAAVAVGVTLLEPTLLSRSREWLLEAPRDPLSAGAADLLVSGSSYRVAAFVLPVCAGILIVRHARSERARLVVAGSCLPVAALVFALDRAGAVELVAYSGSLVEIVFNTAIAGVVACVAWVAASRVGLVGSVIASAGAMALTIYTLQILGDWLYLREGGLSDDQWRFMVGSCVAALVLGAAWMPVMRRTGWRGPLEAPVDFVVRRGRETERVPVA